MKAHGDPSTQGITTITVMPTNTVIRHLSIANQQERMNLEFVLALHMRGKVTQNFARANLMVPCAAFLLELGYLLLIMTCVVYANHLV